MSTEDIQEEIERTRTEMASTLDAIERRLSPRQLMDQAVDTMRDLASDQSRVAHVVRENPIPLALIGLGLAWFAFSGMGKRERGEEAIEGYEGYEGYEGGVETSAPASAWGSPGGLETARSADYGYGYASAGATSGYGAEAGYVGQQPGGDGGMKAKAGQIADQAREGFSRASDETRRKMSQWTRSARHQASHAADRTWETFQDHPITMGAVALLLGAAVGAILPRSRTEEEAMGAQAREALRQAREAAGDLAERAGHVAGTAVEKVKEEAKEAFRDVSQATKEEAQRQGLAGSSGSTMTH